MSSTGKVKLGSLLLVIVLFSSMFIDTLYFIFFSPLMVFILFCVLKKTNAVKLITADYLMMVICVVEIIQLFCTDYTPNTIKTACVIFCGFFLWLIMRFLITESATVNTLISLLSLAFCALSLISLFEYYKHKNYYNGVGIEDLTIVKHLFYPLGFPLNEWVAVLICFLPFSLYSALLNRKRIILFIVYTISFVCVNMSILVSYSRSGYIVLLLFDFLVLLLSLLFYRKTFIHVLIITTIGLFTSLIILIPDSKSITQTYSINKTTSQIRSTNGREKKWTEALDMFKQSPFKGVGSGNYELASRLVGSKNYNTLSYRSTNTLLQILVEKGLIGTAIYLIVFCIGFSCSYKSMRLEPMLIPFFVAIVSLCFREMFFNSLFDNEVFVLFITLYFLVNQSYLRCED